MISNNSISIIIATKNRPHCISENIKHLLKSTVHPSEIIIADQSTNLETEKVITKINNNYIKYHRLQSTGKSKSLNFAIKKATGYLLSFTDDDCLVDKNWIKTIQNTFKRHQEISLLFGKTLAYQPEKNENKTCPCTFSKKPDAFQVTAHPGKHWKNVGFGNNMVVKSRVFDEVGLFKEWLGPGSIGSNAEDAEFINRCLINDYKIGYEPNMIAYHNKWLDKKQERKQNWSYRCGEIACYSWFALNGHQFAKKIIYHNLKKILKNINMKKISAYTIGFFVALVEHLKTFIKKANFS